MNKEWFKEAKYGMFIHWGLYSILAGEYKGERCNYTSEWIMNKFRIPIKEYEKLANVFNPIYFDAEEWVNLAIEFGMKYLVITTKHHEGFSMFCSKVDKYNICDATPFKRDILKELADACHKHNFKFGIYYSQEIDWHEEHGGGYSVESDKWDNKPWSNIWDFPDKNKKDYSICFEKKIKPQVKELLTNYGQIDCIWFDTPADITKEQSLELYNMVKHYQPNCLVNTRIGNGLGDYGTAEDNKLAEEKSKDLFEVPATLNDNWGYAAYDQNFKCPTTVYNTLMDLNSRGINYLLNVGPDYLGRIPSKSIEILKKVGSMLKESNKD